MLKLVINSGKMKTVIAICSLLAVAAAIDLVDFDHAKWTNRIVGGDVVKPHSIPYQVGLKLKMAQGTAWCGGAVISKDYILTAAHCAEPTSEAEVLLGAHDVKAETEEGRVTMTVTKENIIVHENWSMGTLQNDIALLRLPESIEFNEYIQPIALPTRSQQKEKFDGKIAKASGWGRYSDGVQEISPLLRSVDQPIMKNLACKPYFVFMIKDSHICMSGSNKKSTCQGDSGGPLVVDGTHVGATSFGIAFGCEKGWPGVFTRTTEFLDWISENTGIEILP